MKKSLLVLLATIGMLASCTPGTSSSLSESSSSAASSSNSSASSSSSSSVIESSSSSSESSSEVLVVEDPDPTPAYADESPITTRAYNGLFDKTLDDFSGATATGTGTGVYLGAPYLLVKLDPTAEFPGTTSGDPIYKYATGTYAIEDSYQIGFRMKLVAGSLPLNKLKLGLRGGDAWNVYELPFSTLQNGDAEALPELTTEYQDYVVDLNNSIADDTVEYTLSGTSTLSGTRVLSKVLGFHLFAGDAVTAKVALAEVYLVKAGNVTVLDDFNRANVGAADANCWWRGSIGSIVARNVTLNEGTTYSVENTVNAVDYENIVVTIKGDARGLSVQPIIAGVAGTAVAWTTLKDAEGNLLPTTMLSYKNCIVNFAQSGFASGVTGLVFASTAKVSISGLFFSNLITKEAVKQYPYLDTTSTVVFDDFNRTQSGFNGDYNASATNPIVTDAGLYFALSYNHGDLVTVADGHVTLDATTLAEGDYINFKEGSSRGNAGHQYVVFVVKGTDGATLDGFRVGGTAGPVYTSAWRSAFGLNIPTLSNTTYPYIDANGYTYIIVDMVESGLSVTDSIDMYYSGTGKLLIDQIFFANKTELGIDLSTSYPIGSGGTADFTAGGYVYMWGGFNGDLCRYLSLTVTGDGVADLASFRLEYNGLTLWGKDAALIGVDGLPITGELTTEPRTAIIDLVASGYTIAATDMHFHFGDFGTHNGVVIVSDVKGYKDAKYTRWVDEGEHAVSFTNAGYTYGFGINAVNPARYLALELHNDGVAQLTSLRIEAAGQTIMANGALVDINGTKLSDIVLTAETTIIYVDLIASGYDINLLVGMDFHFGGWGDTSGTITFTKIGFMDFTPRSYGEVMGDLSVTIL